MKKLDYVILVVFSVIILIISIIISLLSIGWLDMDIIGNFVRQAILGAKTTKIVLGMSIVCVLLSIKGIFFTTYSKDKSNDQTGALLENANGKLMISKTTLENLVISVVKEFDSVEDTKTLVQLDENNNVTVFVNLVVNNNVIIKELTLNLQNKIKEAIKKTSDLEVKEVNIQIKNITSQNKESK